MVEIFKVCQSCKGIKQKLGMGMLKMEDCTICSGKGKIKIEAEDLNPTPIVKPEIITTTEVNEAQLEMFDIQETKEKPMNTVSLSEFLEMDLSHLKEKIKYPPGKHPNQIAAYKRRTEAAKIEG